MWLWAKWIYQVPVERSDSYETHIEGRHCVGRYKWNPWNPPVQWEIETPSNYRGPVPNILEVQFDHQLGATDNDFPGPYEPFDWNVYYQLRAAYDDSTRAADLAHDMVKAKLDQIETRRNRRREELEYINRDFRAWAQKKLDTVSDVEIKEYLRRQPKRGSNES